MCSHLDALMPDNEHKVVLHQDFWRHRRTCVRCSGRMKPTSWTWQNTACPLEHLVKRPPPKKEEKPAASSKVVKRPSPPAKPKKPVVKKVPSDEEFMAKGLVKISYEVDDDFDGAGGLTGVVRDIWVEDFSKEELSEEVMVMEKDDCIYEEFAISMN